MLNTNNNNKTKIIYLLFLVPTLFLFLSFFIIAFELDLIFIVKSLLLSIKNNLTLSLLVTLVQIQLALFAIIFGLYSISLQHISTTYSSRVSEVLSTHIRFYLILGCISIFWDILLIIILPQNLGRLSYILLLASIVFAIIVSTLSLKKIPNIMYSLKPEDIFNLINESDSLDKNELVLDFAMGSIRKYDIDLLDRCLNLLYYKDLEEIYSTDSNLGTFFNKDREAFERIVSKILMVGKVSVSVKDNRTTSLIFWKLESIFKGFYDHYIAISCLVSVSSEIVEFINYCVENELEDSAKNGTTMLTNLWIELIQNKEIEDPSYYLSNALSSTCDIGRTACDLRYSKLAKYSVECIKDIVCLFIQYESEVNVEYLSKIGLIGFISAEKRLESSTDTVIEILTNIVLLNSKLLTTRNEDGDFSIVDESEKAVLIIDIIGKVADISIDNCNYKCVSSSLRSYDSIMKELESKTHSTKARARVRKWCSYIESKKENLV